MKRLLFFCVALLMGIPIFAHNTAVKQPVEYVRNEGQWEGNFHFRGTTPNGNIYLMPGGFRIVQLEAAFHDIRQRLHNDPKALSDVFKYHVYATAAPRPRFFFVPWDYDGTFGRNWDGSRVGTKEWLSNRLFDRLWADPMMRTRFRQRWETLRAGPFRAEAIGDLIDANAQALGPAIRRNESRWKQIDYAAPRELTFDEDVRQIRAWTSARLAWLDAEIARRAR